MCQSMGHTTKSTAPGEGYSITGICRSANLKLLAVVLVRFVLVELGAAQTGISIDLFNNCKVISI